MSDGPASRGHIFFSGRVGSAGAVQLVPRVVGISVKPPCPLLGPSHAGRFTMHLHLTIDSP